MVTMKGSLSPAVLKKYYVLGQLPRQQNLWEVKRLTVEYPKTMGAPAVH
jgi:hypothetical protein